LHRKITRLGTFQNTVDVAGRATMQIQQVNTVGNQTALADQNVNGYTAGMR
jgi:hypothetical protein